MLTAVQSNPFAAYQLNLEGSATFGWVSRITTNLTRAFCQIGRDPGAKSISLKLSLDEQNLVFSLKSGTVGQTLLGATLITSLPRTLGPSDPGDFPTRYRLGRLSTFTGRLTAYQGPNLVRSTRLDLMV